VLSFKAGNLQVVDKRVYEFLIVSSDTEEFFQKIRVKVVNLNLVPSVSLR